jgi:hypothetical protein
MSTGAFDPSPSSLMDTSSSHDLYRRMGTLSFIFVQPSTTHAPKSADTSPEHDQGSQLLLAASGRYCWRYASTAGET